MGFGTNFNFIITNDNSRNRYSKFFSQLFTSSIDSALDEGLISDIKVVIEQGPIPKSDRRFMINGWRWHTKSVIRDLNRYKAIISNFLSQTSNSTSTSTTDYNNIRNKQKVQINRVISCHNFVCNFNWKALDRVDSKIFFPWLTTLLPGSAQPLISDILEQHDVINNLVGKIDVLFASLKVEDNISTTISTIHTIDNYLDNVISNVMKIQKLQENIFVPYVAAYVNVKEQDYFNNKVISTLGLLDSQIHLVSMVEAIKDHPEELKLFKAQIPGIAQRLIPLWRNRLYSPKTKCFDE
eukprot:gene4944-6917_t